MAHALHYKKDPYRYGVEQDHGKTFERIAKTLATKVLKRKQELPKPFSECEIDPKTVASARKHTQPSVNGFQLLFSSGSIT